MLHYITLQLLASTSLLLTQQLVTLPTSFFIIIQTFSMEIIFGEFPGHFRLGTLLYSRNVLSILELLHVTISCIKIYPFCGNIKHSHASVFQSHNNQRHCLVWRKQNEKDNAKCIQTNVRSPVSVQVWGAISSRSMSPLRKVNGNMDSAKYQSDIIHDIEMTC